MKAIAQLQPISPQQPQKRDSTRNYKCPCGKTYLSYAALFTHIKQKHQGKAPGPIQKPYIQKKLRGRPPLLLKQKKSYLDQDIQNTKDPNIQQSQKNKIYWNNFSLIFIYLKSIHQQQKINFNVWEQINCFKKFQSFIDHTQSKSQFLFKGVNLGYGLSQFLKHISLQTKSSQFQQILILFMLLLQYVFDQSNSQSIIQQAPIQILIQYMNPFLTYHIHDFAQYLGISGLWIMDKNNIRNIFMCFYNWLKWKDYTNFCITLID